MNLIIARHHFGGQNQDRVYSPAGPVLGMCNMCNRTGPRTLGAPRFHDFNLQVYCVKSSTASVPVSEYQAAQRPH